MRTFSNTALMPIEISEIASRGDCSVIVPGRPKSHPNFPAHSPVMVSNMDSTGTLKMAFALTQHRCFTALHKYYTADELISFFNSSCIVCLPYSFISVGLEEGGLEKLIKVQDHFNYPINICLDVANGYMRSFINFFQTVRNRFPKSYLMAGNICSPEIVDIYADFGVDCVKAGIGNGGHCETSKITGIGIPQLELIYQLRESYNYGKIDFCSDGGVTCPGDIVKLLVAGADFVMCGGMFAGTDECEGKFDKAESHKFFFYGMSSKHANEKYNGELCNYKASEGKASWIDAKGPVENVIQEIHGGIRSAMSYCGHSDISDLIYTRSVRLDKPFECGASVL